MSTEFLTLNLGCGERVFDFYPDKRYTCINFDERALASVNQVGDVRDLSRFPDEAFDYILASDIIEHFPIAETMTILKEWKRVLKPNGTIEFRFPDLDTICKKYVNGEHDTRKTSWLLYGGQTYSGNFHYVGFDSKWFIEILRSIEFKVVNLKVVGNNLEVKAERQ